MADASLQNVTFVYFPDCILEGYNIEKSDIGDPEDVRTVKNCHYLCTQRPECNYWTYQKSSKKCFLKREVTSIVKSSNYQSGAKLCLDKQKAELEVTSKSTCPAIIGTNYSGGETLKVLHYGYNSREACQKKCQTTLGCKFYIVYHGVSFSVVSVEFKPSGPIFDREATQGVLKVEKFLIMFFVIFPFNARSRSLLHNIGALHNHKQLKK